MRTPIKLLVRCWLFVLVAFLLAATAFGQNFIGAGNCSNSAVKYHAATVQIGGTVANGTYNVNWNGTKTSPSGSGPSTGGWATVTVVSNAGTITAFGDNNWDITSNLSNGQTTTYTCASSVPCAVVGSYSVTRTDCASCASCSSVHDGSTTTYNVTFTLGSGPVITGTSHFSGQLHVGRHAKAHTFALLYNGATVFTDTSPVNNSAPYTSQINYNNTMAHNGDTWAWVVDGVTQGSGTVTLTNIGTPEAPIYSYTTTYDASVSGGDAPTPTPSATPTPTAFPTATPYATPTATPGGTPPPSVIPYTRGSGSGFSQAVTVVNPADIYNPIVADIDKTNSLLSQLASPAPAPTPDLSSVVNKLDEMEHNGTTAPGTATDTHESADFTNRGHIDDLQGSVDSAISARNDVVTSLTDVINTFIGDASALSGASFGNTTTIPMPFSFIGHAPAVGKIDLPDTVDLSNWSGLIAMLRAVLLWLLRIAFWVLVYKLFAAHGIQAT